MTHKPLEEAARHNPVPDLCNGLRHIPEQTP